MKNLGIIQQAGGKVATVTIEYDRYADLITCLYCQLPGRHTTTQGSKLVEHLGDHVRAGHKVPPELFDAANDLVRIHAERARSRSWGA